MHIDVKIMTLKINLNGEIWFSIWNNNNNLRTHNHEGLKTFHNLEKEDWL